MVDERAVYLARLVRDLSMPVPPLVDLLNDVTDDDPDNGFENTLDVLEVLGRAGDEHAIDGLRRYVREGPHWLDVLHTIARDWPRDLWDDLLPVAHSRLTPDDDGPLWRGRPWVDWAVVDETIAARAAAFRPLPRPERPFRERPIEDVFALMADGDADRRRAALFELNRRGPQPGLLAVVDALPMRELGGSLGLAVERLGALAVPHLRAWAASPDHPLIWTAYRVLAEHGDDSDLETLLAGWDWLRGRDGTLCGFQNFADGIARIGGPAALAAVPRLWRAWFWPHTYERVAFLRAITALDPDLATKLHVEGLWDCESRVRQLAAAHVRFDDGTRERLVHLRDDPMETPEVRATAASRLG
ncbi:hypothetical protein ACFQX7_17765 [Luedemannella flava]